MDFKINQKLHFRLAKIIKKLGLSHIKAKNIVCFVSCGSRSRAYARIWSLPKIWQTALEVSPHYCLEVISEKFSPLSEEQQTKVLIHELLHIPKNFSGALLPHRRRKHRIDARTVNRWFKRLK